MAHRSTDRNAVLPEGQNVGSMAINDLMLKMSVTFENTLDEKMKNLPTKDDIEFIKIQINDLVTQVDILKTENQCLKDEVSNLKMDKMVNNQRISLIEEQLKRRNIILRGLSDNTKAINEEVNKLFREKLKMADPILKSTKKIHSHKGKITVVAELESSEAVEEVLKRSKMLANTQIYLDRDLCTEKQQQKRVMIQLKRELVKLRNTHKVSVRDYKLKIGDKWFMWDKHYNLKSGSEDGNKVLKKLYKNDITNIELNYDKILSKINSQ